MTEPAQPDLDRLYREHYRAVLRYVVRRHGDVEDARDVAAEVFLVAWQRRADLPAGRPLPWLYRVAANLLAHRYRSAERASSLHRRAGNDLVTRTAVGRRTARSGRKSCRRSSTRWQRSARQIKRS